MNKTLTPVIYRGKELPDYFLDKDGNLYSTKRTFLHKLVVSNHNDKYNYDHVNLCIRRHHHPNHHHHHHRHHI